MPFGVGLVQLGDVVRVEGRLTENDPAKLKFGMEVELTMMPFATDEEGNEIVTFAFRPVDPKGARHDQRRRDHRRGPAPVRPVRQVRDGDGRRRHPAPRSPTPASSGTTSSSASAAAGGRQPRRDRRPGRADRHHRSPTCSTPAPPRPAQPRHAADAIRLGKYDIGIAVGLDKHPRGAFTDDPALARHARLVRRERPVLTTQVLRHEGQPLPARPRHLRRTLAKVAAKNFRNGALNNRMRSAASRSPKRRSSTRRC